MIELRKEYKKLLKEVHSVVYYEDAQQDITYPYLTYNINISEDDGEALTSLIITVEGFDKTSDSTVIETLMENVKKKLNKAVVISEYDGKPITIITYFENQYPLDIINPEIKRRSQTYLGRKYGGN